MSSAAPNPRRRPARDTDSPMTLIDTFQKMSIRKGDTFHPTSTAADNAAFWDPLESRAKSPATPMRSDTSPQSLEDLLIGSGERRVAQLLHRVDQAVATNSKLALSNVLSEPDVLPLPSLDVNRADVPGEPSKTRTRHHSHSSDSGIGTSIGESVETASESDRASSRTATANSSGKQSLASISDAADEERGLSKYAADQIHKYIIKPILREDSLKEFHGLIKSVPSRIGDKEIKTLRDLEKTLIFLAPDYSLSPSKYLHFCERTIRVLHSTVTTLHESDQRAPTDRPYTQGYFFDLVEQVRLGSSPSEAAVIDRIFTQIRRYATILAATRAAQEKEQKASDEMPVTKERVSLHGGMNQNGKQAELVRHTADGKVISLADNRELTAEELANPSTKRSADVDDMDEDEAMRSMARRKKNAKPEIHTCELCSKEFKRPCDLTKHVKTHERPWKCPTEDCKYHDYGWPTEKERDRHVNDKHSSTPALYHCLFPPCPYTSKRESNCKQHMEKAHGWNYVRSKSNGKGRTSSVVRLHHGSVPPSPASSMLTPLTPIAPSPSIHSLSESSRRGSMAPPPTAGPSNYGTPAFTAPSPDFSNHFNMNNMNFDFNDMANFPNFPITPAMSEDQRDSVSLSSHSELQYDGSNFDDGSPQDYDFDNFNWADFNIPSYTPDSSAAAMSSGAPHISPAVQMDQTFTNDAMHLDDTYNDFTTGPTQDFTLFGATAPAATGGEMFPSLTTDGNWGNVPSSYGNHFDATENPAPMPVGNSTLEELFPGLNQSR